LPGHRAIGIGERLDLFGRDEVLKVAMTPSKSSSVRGSAPGAEEIGLAPVSLERLRRVVTQDGWETLQAALHECGGALLGRTVWMVNSTAVGGGVAEMLRTLLPYTLGAGFDVRWSVVRAGPAFFRVTKRVHNMLHGYSGDGGDLGSRERRVYERGLEPAMTWLKDRVRAGDIVVLHDPQTTGLAPALTAAGARVVLRSHVGAEHANTLVRAARDFLWPYAAGADAMVFTRAADPPPQLRTIRTAAIHPSIDPCSAKNRDMTDAEARGLLVDAGLVAADRRSSTGQERTQKRLPGRASVIRRTGRAPRIGFDRLVLHLARWDRLKDPVGVMEAFTTTMMDVGDARLILAGPAVRDVTDDPEAGAVYREVESRWHRLPRAQRDHIDLVRLSMHDKEANATLVNALQRAASVIVKKSLEEGFGLGVTEAMWKSRPVIASGVGGHRDQIEDGVSGVLVDPRDLPRFGQAISEVLLDEQRAQRLGDAANERVRARYLPDHALAAWLGLLSTLA
jgi:trehalose synthase